MNFLLYFQNIAPCNKNNRGNLHACIQVNELQRGMYFSSAGCWDCMKRGPMTSAVRNKGLLWYYWGTAANGVSAVVSVGWRWLSSGQQSFVLTKGLPYFVSVYCSGQHTVEVKKSLRSVCVPLLLPFAFYYRFYYRFVTVFITLLLCNANGT